MVGQPLVLYCLHLPCPTGNGITERASSIFIIQTVAKVINSTCYCMTVWLMGMIPTNSHTAIYCPYRPIPIHSTRRSQAPPSIAPVQIYLSHLPVSLMTPLSWRPRHKKQNFNQCRTIPVRSCQCCIVISIEHFGLSLALTFCSKYFLARLLTYIALGLTQACCCYLTRHAAMCCDAATLEAHLRSRHPMTLAACCRQFTNWTPRVMSQLGWLKMCCGVNNEWARRKKRSILRLMVLPLWAMSYWTCKCNAQPSNKPRWHEETKSLKKNAKN